MIMAVPATVAILPASSFVRMPPRDSSDAAAPARPAGASWETPDAGSGVPAGTPEDTPDRRVLSPLTAFDEMEVLEREGKLGWHVVDFGPFFHVVERSDHPWEHRRVPFAVGPRLRKLEADGWTAVGAWFPWRYLKRPLPPPPRG